MISYDSTSPWGTYPPPKQAKRLLLLVKLGLGRGLICKWIRRFWIRNYPTLVDLQVDGIKYRLDVWRNTTDGKLMSSSKKYDGTEIDHLAKACQGPGSVFVDVGANTGHYALTLAQLGCQKVLAIEPNPPTLSLLRFNVAANAFDSIIAIEPVCVGKHGKVQLYCTGGLGAASIVRQADQATPVLVDSHPLLDLISRQGLTRIDALKIDVEGAEDLALIPFFESAPKQLWPGMVVIENCHQDAWQINVIEHMKGLGYKEAARTRGNLILRLD